MLSRTYHPSDKLRPYIRRFYVFEAELPKGAIIEDFLLSETGFVRCLLKGEWTGETAPGKFEMPGRALLFGSNAAPLKVRVEGSFALAGFAIRPSAWRCLAVKPHGEFVDTIRSMEEMVGIRATEMLKAVEAAPNDAAKIAAMEKFILDRITSVGSPEPDTKMAEFDKIARVNSTIRVDEAAERIGLSTRQMARRCTASFGLTPKAVLRRSRFLDLATAIRGFSSPSEADLANLRFYDQSHLTREFKRFTNLSVRQPRF